MSIGIVNTKYGKLQGVEYEGKYSGVTVFKGIPYAAPPIGRLRWAPPEDPEPWEGVRMCDTFAPAPPQNFKSYATEREVLDSYFEGFPKTSEDCLYLTICTGAQEPQERRPVYMWFHGGGLKYGYATEVQFNPQELCRKGIVVVHVAQRCGAFGYLSLPQLSAEQGGRSGNYGLMDQFKALDWVCENISAFGGDPENITVGGQSGGSHKACAMAASPVANGRIKRVINETGLRWMQTFPSMETAEKRGVSYLRYQGINPDLPLEKLRELNTEEIYKKDTAIGIVPGEMVCDGVLIPYNDFREGFETYLGEVDFINTTNLGEADVFADTSAGFEDLPVSDFLTEIKSAADFYAHFENLLGKLFMKYDFPHLVSVSDDNAWYMARRLASLGLTGRLNHSYPGWAANFGKNLMLDRIFGMYLAQKHPQNQVYTMLWSHFMPVSNVHKGTAGDPDISMAWHSSELWFTFASLRKGIPPERPWTDNDFEVADIISSYWANFIRTGNPNGNGLPYWPCTAKDYGYIEVEEEVIQNNGIHDSLQALIHEFVCAEYNVDW